MDDRPVWKKVVESTGGETNMQVFLNGADDQEVSNQGWIRDLTVEGIEPNPGPAWQKLLETVEKNFTTDYPKIQGHLEKFEEFLKKAFESPAITTAEVEEFFKDEKLQAQHKVPRGVASMIQEGLSILKESQALPSGKLQTAFERLLKREAIPNVSSMSLTILTKFVTKYLLDSDESKSIPNIFEGGATIDEHTVEEYFSERKKVDKGSSEANWEPTHNKLTGVMAKDLAPHSHWISKEKVRFLPHPALSDLGFKGGDPDACLAIEVGEKLQALFQAPLNDPLDLSDVKDAVQELVDPVFLERYMEPKVKRIPAYAPVMGKGQKGTPMIPVFLRERKSDNPRYPPERAPLQLAYYSIMAATWRALLTGELPIGVFGLALIADRASLYWFSLLELPPKLKVERVRVLDLEMKGPEQVALLVHHLEKIRTFYCKMDNIFM